MGSLLDDASRMEHRNPVAEFAGGQAVADVDGGFVLYNLVKLFVNLRLCDGVQSGGGLIQNDEGGILVKGPGDGDFLSLASGDVHPILVIVLVKIGFQPLGHFLQPVSKAGFLEAVLRPYRVIIHLSCHILPQRQGKKLEILKHHGEDIHVLSVVIFPDVNAVEKNLPLRGVVQAAQ